MKPRFRYQADLFDSSEDIAQIIDAESDGHPQGPVVLATVNVRWCAPHVHHAVHLGHAMAAATEMLEVLELADATLRVVGVQHPLVLERIQSVIARAKGGTVV